MVGGERQVYERIRPILAAFAGKVVYAGELGSGTVCKLVHNMMNFSVRQVLAEGMTLGVKAGLDLDVILESGERGFWHPLTAKLAETAFLDKYEPPSFTLALSRKDIGLATELARDVNVPLPIASAVEQMMMQAMGRGWGEKDSVIAFRLQEELAGVEVRSGPGA